MSENTLLIVDDSADDIELLLRAFESISFRPKIVVARDGQEALDYLCGRGKYDGRDRRATPVLTILDLKMPRIGGLEVVRSLRADTRLRNLMTIILSSSDEDRDRAEALKLGANLYFNKPFNFDDYIGLARKINTLFLDAIGR